MPAKTPIASVVKKQPAPATARLTIRSDESAKRRIADTDGTLRRSRQIAEDNRLR